MRAYRSAVRGSRIPRKLSPTARHEPRAPARQLYALVGEPSFKTYEELKAKGVQFAGPPEERFYGIEAIMKDGQGNWFSMTQHKTES